MINLFSQVYLPTSKDTHCLLKSAERKLPKNPLQAAGSKGGHVKCSSIKSVILRAVNMCEDFPVELVPVAQLSESHSWSL